MAGHASNLNQPRVLPSGYYLNNFLLLLRFVTDQYRDLLSPSELNFTQIFHDLSQDAGRLYVRLIMRKGPHFRADKLHYPEITDLAAACLELLRAGLLAKNLPLPADQLLVLLARAELVTLIQQQSQRFPSLTKLSGQRKQCLLGAVINALDVQEIRDQLFLLFDVYTPQHGDVLRVFRLLFFGNLNQDFTEFVLLDLGLLRYEDYPIKLADRLFNQRDLLDHTLAYLVLRDQAWLAIQARDCDSLATLCLALPPTLDEPSLLRRHDRILNDCGRFFERDGQLQRALDCYERAQLPPSRERRARILEKQGAYQSSLDLCEQIRMQSRGEDELAFALMFSAKLAKKLARQVPTLPRINHPLLKLVLDSVPDCDVEQAVLNHFDRLGIDGFYAENRLWQNLFGLLFWDIIFAPVRAAFFNHYQRGPKDLFSAGFRTARMDAVSARLAQIAEGRDLWPVLSDTIDRKNGIANYLVNWRFLEPTQLQRVLAIVPAVHLTAIFSRICIHPGLYKTGLPDLFLFTGELGYLLVEVKGPGDQLQGNQGRWLRYFQEHQIPYAVARVKWSNK